MRELCRHQLSTATPGDPVAVMADKFRAQLREVASTTNTSTRNVIGQQVADASNELLQRLPRKSALEQTVIRKRRRTEEPLANPVSLNFDIPRNYQHIVLYDSGPEGPRRILALTVRTH